MDTNGYKIETIYLDY